MSQMISAFSDVKFANQLKAGLQNTYAVDVIAKKDAIETNALLEIFPETELVVTSDDNAIKICQFITKIHDSFAKDIKVLIVGEKKTPFPYASNIPLNTPLPLIIHQIGFLLGKETEPANLKPPEPEPSPEPAPSPAPTPGPVQVKTPVKAPPGPAEDDGELNKTTVFKMPEMKKAPAPAKPAATQAQKKVIRSDQYHAFHIKYFIPLQDTKITFNVYSRLKKGDGFEYNVKIAAGSVINRTELERMIIRSSKELFVANQDVPTATEILNTHFIAQFKKPTMSPIDRLLLNSDAYEILLDLFRQNIFDKYTIEIIQGTLKSLDITMKLPDQFQLLQFGISSRKLFYGYYHMHMSCMLINQLIDKFPWSKDQSKNKLLYLSLFCDICLHNEKLIRVNHNYFKEEAKLSEEDKAIVNNHADAAATILTKMKAAPELATIVREHHGSKVGKGFSHTLSVTLAPLNMGFMVIQDFVTKYLAIALNKEDPNDKVTSEELAPLLSELALKYDKLTYADVAAALQIYVLEQTANL